MHVLLFAITWLCAVGQDKPLLDGPARWGFVILFFADFPVSVVGFSAMWDGKFLYGLLLWGFIGTVWWYFLAMWIRSLYSKRSRFT